MQWNLFFPSQFMEKLSAGEPEGLALISGIRVW